MNVVYRLMYALGGVLTVVGGVVGRGGRWVIRRPRNVVIFLILLVLAVCVWLAGLSVAAIRNAEANRVGDGPLVEPLVAVTALPVAGSAADAAQGTVSATAGPSLHMGQGPQAPAPGQTLAPASPVEISAPVQPVVDSAKPEEVAVGWAKAFFSRPEGVWGGWVPWVKSWVEPGLLQQMVGDEFNARGALDGKQAAQVVDVRLSAADGSTGRDTPVRWSRTAEIDVQTADGRVTTVTYVLEESLTEKGWVILNAEKKFWTVK